MPTQINENEIELIKDFLKERGYTSTLECFIKEDNYKKVERKNAKKKKIEVYAESKFTKYLKTSREKIIKYTKLEDSYKLLEKKYKTILQCARQSFSISINCLELLKDIKNGNNKDNLEEIIEDYKSQIGKYHKILMNDTWDETTRTVNEAIIKEHKNNLKKAINEKNNDKIQEILLSLRIYSLQIQPDLRKNLIEELVDNDILNIKENNSVQYILDLLNIQSYNIRHAVLSFLSIIASLTKGVEYLSSIDNSILEKTIEIMKTTEDGQVLQRFCIAFIQKMSVKESNIQSFLKYGLIDWFIKLILRSKNNQIHIFCLDFSSALIANILQSNVTLDFLEKNIAVCKNLIETFLKMIKEKIHSSVLMHFLICLNLLNIEKFKTINEECQLNEKIKEFIEFYENIDVVTENEKFEKKTVLDLCNSLFNNNNKESNNDEGGYENKFKEFENEQRELIFESFQDEIS